MALYVVIPTDQKNSLAIAGRVVLSTRPRKEISNEKNIKGLDESGVLWVYTRIIRRASSRIQPVAVPIAAPRTPSAGSPAIPKINIYPRTVLTRIAAIVATTVIRTN